MPSQDQTTSKRLVDGLYLQLRSDRALGNDVDDRTEGCGDAHAVDCLDVASAEPRMAEAEHVGNGSHPSEPGRHRHIQLRRHHVGKIVQCQRSRIAEHPLGLILSVPRPELPDHEVGPGRARELRQPVDTACFANPVAGSHLVRVDAVHVPRIAGLAGGEKPALSLGRLVELPERGSVARQAIKPQMN